MAEYVTVKERTLYKIPDNVTFEQAAAVELLSVAVHACIRIAHQTGRQSRGGRRGHYRAADHPGCQGGRRDYTDRGRY